MKKVASLILIAGVIACHKKDALTLEPEPAFGPVQTATGRLSNYGAVDGCGLLLTIPKDPATNTEFAISEKSDSLVKRYLVFANGVANLKATVQFQQTGRNKGVFCGFSGFKPFDEVILLSIKPI